MTEKQRLARNQLIIALHNLMQYDRGTVGHREALDKLIPDAIEAIVDARVAAIVTATLDPIVAANDEIIRQMKATQP